MNDKRTYAKGIITGVNLAATHDRYSELSDIIKFTLSNEVRVVCVDTWALSNEVDGFAAWFVDMPSNTPCNWYFLADDYQAIVDSVTSDCPEDDSKAIAHDLLIHIKNYLDAFELYTDHAEILGRFGKTL